MTACIVCGAPAGAPPVPGAGPAYQAPLGGFDAYAPGTQPAAPYPSPPFAPPGPPPGAPFAGPSGFGAARGAGPIGPGWMGAPAALPLARENNFAAVSLVCGALGLIPFWVGFILCILAIGFGIAGIQRAGILPGQRGRGMAIAGLVLGLVFILPAGCGL